MNNRLLQRLVLLITLALSGTIAIVATADAQQFSEWSLPVNLGPIINSEFNDQHPAISKNRLSLYFVSDRPGGFGGNDLWVSHRSNLDAPWETPQNLGPTINTPGIEFSPTLSPNQHWLFFGSDRPGGCGGEDIWVSHREDEGDDLAWETPVNLGCTMNSATNDDGPTLFVEEETITLYFTSFKRPGGLGDWDIYASTMNEDDGTFGPAVLVPELSSPFRDTRTAIRKDGLEIFITSARPGGQGPVPTLDIWVSTRLNTKDTWGTPVNLGPSINSTANDGAPALSHDGTTLYFYSNRAGGFGANDLYMATRTRLRDRDDDSSASQKE